MIKLPWNTPKIKTNHVLSEAGDVCSIGDVLPSLWHICFLQQTVKFKKKKEAQ